MTTYASPTRSPLTRLVRQLGIDTQYVLLGFPIGILTVSLFLTAFFTGIGLVVLWVGIPLLVATLMMARGFATVER
ncbi:MAG TPA: sensor domain-containing protein, partial [Actinoplanes sp.]|nr:sensor domain-containing protein [Actinoplanes sp.]